MACEMQAGHELTVVSYRGEYEIMVFSNILEKLLSHLNVDQEAQRKETVKHHEAQKGTYPGGEVEQEEDTKEKMESSKGEDGCTIEDCSCIFETQSRND